MNVAFTEQSKREYAERLWAKVDRTGGPDACWPFAGAVRYGRITIYYQEFLAHRLAFAVTYGYWPENALHWCDNQPCCNPRHLHDGTLAQNNLEMAERGRSNRGKRMPQNKTHCRNGHEYTPENTYISPQTGSYCCRECNRIRARENKLLAGWQL